MKINFINDSVVNEIWDCTVETGHALSLQSSDNPPKTIGKNDFEIAGMRRDRACPVSTIVRQSAENNW